LRGALSFVPHFIFDYLCFASGFATNSGTSVYFFYTTLFQTSWILFYSFADSHVTGLFIPSFVSIVGALLSLFYLLRSQEQQLVGGAGRGIAEYLLFRLPFYWETGWMTILVAHHFSLLFRAFDAQLSIQVGVDVFCLGILSVVALLMTFQGRDLVVPLVILTAYMAIASRLDHPSEAIVNLLVHGDVLIMDAMRIACYFFAGTITCCVIPVLVIWFSHEFCTIQVVELENE